MTNDATISLLDDLSRAWVEEQPFIPNCFNTIEAASWWNR